MTGTIWLMLTILLRFILQDPVQFYISLSLGAALVILPIVNHVRIFFVIRRHNNHVQDAVSGQNLSVIYKREKKATVDMLIVIAVLMLCLAPGTVISVFRFGDNFEVLFPWSLAFTYINSSINPVVYLVRNSGIRNNVKALMCFNL